MSKRTQALLTKSLVLVNKSARTALDASYAVEELCGLIDPLTEENRMLTKHCSKLEKEIDRWKNLMAKEVARLKSEVERLTNCKSEADRLKAEVERLRAGSFVTAVPSEHYERVIKAGDALVLKVPDIMAGCVRAEEAIGLMNNWIAAKEGKQS